MFGVGEYSYSVYKAAVSGFFKDPAFALLHSTDLRHVMTDDTCYFLAFSSYSLAYTAMLYLNTAKVRAFIKGLSFADAKRPYTKKVLERIDFSKICRDIDYDTLKVTECSLGLPPYITPQMAEEFCKTVSLHSNAVFA
ncbi:MAG: hypothetical protein LUD51_07155 [Clostridia bacterium]|nr:hypothetical protein [Clostridia bacterium]